MSAADTFSPDQLAIEEIKLYREWAFDYFSTRSNITYVDILAAALVTSFLLKYLKDSNTDIKTAVNENFFVIFVACTVLFFFNVWAVCMCNVFSNSFFKYIEMAQKIEITKLHVAYELQSGPVTEEFLDPAHLDKPNWFGMTGNLWNLVNVTLAGYTALVLYACSLLSGAKVKEKYSAHIFPFVIFEAVVVFALLLMSDWTSIVICLVLSQILIGLVWWVARNGTHHRPKATPSNAP